MKLLNNIRVGLFPEELRHLIYSRTSQINFDKDGREYKRDDDIFNNTESANNQYFEKDCKDSKYIVSTRLERDGINKKVLANQTAENKQ